MDWYLVLILVPGVCYLVWDEWHRRYVLLKCPGCKVRLRRTSRLVHTCKPCHTYQQHECGTCKRGYWVVDNRRLVPVTERDPWEKTKT